MDPNNLVDNLNLTEIIDRSEPIGKKSFWQSQAQQVSIQQDIHHNHTQPQPIKYTTENIEVDNLDRDKLEKKYLANLDTTGQQPKQVEDEISNILKQMADQGDNYAKNQLAMAYLFGYFGVEKDVTKGLLLLTQTAESGDKVAQRNIAIFWENNEPKDQQKAVEYYKMVVDNKEPDPYALNNLGACYLIGDGVKANPKKAIELFSKAAEKGDVYGKINLGDAYFLGNGVKKDYTKAFELYKEASNTKDTIALKRLAECYLDGKGTEVNYSLALDCYRQAMEQGDEGARIRFAQLEDKIKPVRHFVVNNPINSRRSIDEVLDEKTKEAHQLREEKNQQPQQEQEEKKDQKPQEQQEQKEQSAGDTPTQNQKTKSNEQEL